MLVSMRPLMSLPAEPTGYWPSNLPPDTPIAELARLAKIR